MSEKVVDIVPNLDAVRDTAARQLSRRIASLTRTAEIKDIPMIVVLLNDEGAVYYTNPAAGVYYLQMCGALDEVKAYLRGDLPIEEA